MQDDDDFRSLNFLIEESGAGDLVASHDRRSNSAEALFPVAPRVTQAISGSFSSDALVNCSMASTFVADSRTRQREKLANFLQEFGVELSASRRDAIHPGQIMASAKHYLELGLEQVSGANVAADGGSGSVSSSFGSVFGARLTDDNDDDDDDDDSRRESLLRLLWENCLQLVEMIVYWSLYLASHPLHFGEPLLQQSWQLMQPPLIDQLRLVNQHTQSAVDYGAASVLRETLARQQTHRQLGSALSGCVAALQRLIDIASAYQERVPFLPTGDEILIEDATVVAVPPSLSSSSSSSSTQPTASQPSSLSPRLQVERPRPTDSLVSLHSRFTNASAPSSPSKAKSPRGSGGSQTAPTMIMTPPPPKRPARVFSSGVPAQLLAMMNDVRKYLLSQPSGLSTAEFSTSLQNVAHLATFSHAHQAQALRMARQATDALNTLSLAIARSVHAAKYAELVARAIRVQQPETYNIDKSLEIDDLDQSMDALSISVRNCRLNAAEIAGSYATALHDLLLAMETVQRKSTVRRSTRFSLAALPSPRGADHQRKHAQSGSDGSDDMLLFSDDELFSLDALDHYADVDQPLSSATTTVIDTLSPSVAAAAASPLSLPLHLLQATPNNSTAAASSTASPLFAASISLPSATVTATLTTTPVAAAAPPSSATTTPPPPTTTTTTTTTAHMTLNEAGGGSPAKLTRMQSVVMSRELLLYKLVEPFEGVAMRDRKISRKVYRNTFLGCEFVDWALKNLAYIHTRERAAQLGSSLLDDGWLESIGGKTSKPLRDKKSAVYAPTQKCFEVYSRRVRSGGLDSNASNMLASPPKMREIVLRILERDSGLVLKDRTVKFKTIKACFAATELVSWLVGNIRALAVRSEAVTFCRLLALHRLITAALPLQTTEFADNKDPWLFTDGSTSRRPLVACVSKDGHVTPTSHMATLVYKHAKATEKTTTHELDLPGGTQLQRQPGKAQPQIIEASPEVLFSRLIHGKVIDNDFELAYLIIFRLWMTPADLLGLLVHEFRGSDVVEVTSSTGSVSGGTTDDDDGSSNSSADERQLSAAQQRILTVVRNWLGHWFDDWHEKPLLAVLASFVESAAGFSDAPPLLRAIDELVKSKSATYEALDRMTSTIASTLTLPGDPGSSSSSGGGGGGGGTGLGLGSSSGGGGPPAGRPAVALLAFMPEVVAEQLTILFFLRYRQLTLADCLDASPAETQAAMSLTALFNTISATVIGTLLCTSDLGERRRLLELWVRVAHLLLKQQNFLGAMAVHTALNDFHCRRLLRTWSALPDQCQEYWQALSDVLSHRSNFSLLRYAQSVAKPPFVPYVGMYFRDLIAVRDGGPLILPARPPETFSTVVLFGRCSHVAPVCKRILAGQFSCYPFQHDASVMQEIYRLCAYKLDNHDDIERLSSSLEPPDTSATSMVEHLSIRTQDLQTQLILQASQIQTLTEENRDLRTQLHNLVATLRDTFPAELGAALLSSTRNEPPKRHPGSAIRPRNRDSLMLMAASAAADASSSAAAAASSSSSSSSSSPPISPLRPIRKRATAYLGRTAPPDERAPSATAAIIHRFENVAKDVHPSRRSALTSAAHQILSKSTPSQLVRQKPGGRSRTLVSASNPYEPAASTSPPTSPRLSLILPPSLSTSLPPPPPPSSTSSSETVAPTAADVPSPLSRIVRIKLDDDGLLRQLALHNTYKTISIEPTDTSGMIIEKVLQKIVHPIAEAHVRTTVYQSLKKWSLALRFAENHGDRWMWLEDDQRPLKLITDSRPPPQLCFAKPLSLPFMDEK